MVIVGIGNWIELLPSMFLQDAYLKYLAWALSDKVGAGLCFMHIDMDFPGSPCTKTGFDEHASPRSNCHCTGNKTCCWSVKGLTYGTELSPASAAAAIRLLCDDANVDSRLRWHRTLQCARRR